MPKPTVSTLRALAADRGFAVERSLTGARWKLVDLGIGHRIKNRRWPSFTLKEAVVFLRHVEGREERWLDFD
jgi:hypothetical protein